ncbi:type IV pilus modification PilV family protein [Paenibacillus abyssi]|uniref:Prepilin-type N-terminal cleavage/methylation domain-containing protein n=1 Tax=Paenibacillus abyssi TaxID=1340531 RepID=A0A917G575_9BACL|nr:prepilin-type N-terminal cleavage/methylation domain-containing protein [Paenibacillus abyssi]GGG23489.1 hypothetical protein GCM10010916_45080 [Paenibacillus abyssi]
MNNQKGLTLIEILGSVTLLAVAVLAITALLQQTSLFAKDNEAIDQSVSISRTVMEEIKRNLASRDSISLFEDGQTLALTELRDNAPAYKLPYSIYYPNAADPQFEVKVESDVYNLSDIHFKDQTYQITDYFRLIRVTSINLTTNKSYILEGYAEYKP